MSARPHHAHLCCLLGDSFVAFVLTIHYTQSTPHFFAMRTHPRNEDGSRTKTELRVIDGTKLADLFRASGFWEIEFVVPHPYTVAPPQATPPLNHGIDKLPGVSDYDIPL